MILGSGSVTWKSVYVRATTIRDGDIDYTSSVLTVLPGRAVVSFGFIRIYVRPSTAKLSMSNGRYGKQMQGDDRLRHV